MAFVFQGLSLGCGGGIKEGTDVEPRPLTADEQEAEDAMGRFTQDPSAVPGR